MQRRGASRQPAKGRRTNRPKVRKAPIARSSTADLDERVAALTRELKETRDHQMATGEILASLTGSIPDAKPVFQAIVRNLQRLFDTRLAVVQVLKDGIVHLAAAGHEEYETLAKEFPRALDDKTGGSRAIVSKQVVQFASVLGNPVAPPTTQQFARDLGFNSVIFAPMIRGDQVIGSIFDCSPRVAAIRREGGRAHQGFRRSSRHRHRERPPTQRARQRTTDLTESLEQQTATSEVLRVISSSEGELEPVFQTMLANATRICEAAFGSMLLYEAELFRRVATHNPPPMFAEFHKNTPILDPRKISDLKLIVETKRPVHVVDVAAVSPDTPIVKYAGARSLLVVPLLKEDDLLGAIGIYRQEVRPFTDKQIELVTNFAAQAVVAIENARLLNELRQRTDDLSESLEQQTATSEVLSVISSSAGELQPVFDTMLAKAVDLCEASFGAMWLVDGDGYRTAALHGDLPEAYVEQWRSGTLHRPKADIAMVRAIRSRKPVHVTDARNENAFLEGDPLAVSAVEVAGIRTLLAVPMLKEGEAIGLIAIYRKEVRPFIDKKIELVSNFAAQAWAKRTCPFALHMSANDPKRTCPSALHMSAFGGKADVTIALQNVCF